jgi:hypothetical protein
MGESVAMGNYLALVVGKKSVAVVVTAGGAAGSAVAAAGRKTIKAA